MIEVKRKRYKLALRVRIYLVRFPQVFCGKLALWWGCLRVFTERDGKESRVPWVWFCARRVGSHYRVVSFVRFPQVF
ncbi:hypothetical protein [Treponema zioleckii]|uniref:hypothetical protein n=1 Tax=Treponema zioleckii TaxID=331680 RepID=UPI00168A7C0B|nr:hypothetical protein [Treponema zioleckii]